METLFNVDLSLFRFINSSLANPVADVFFPFITEAKNVLPMYILALAGLAILGKRKGLVVVSLLLVLIVISDQVSSAVIKPWVERIRPCNNLEGVRLLIGCGGGKSFPSSHAVNNFAAAVFITRYYRKAMPYVYVIASLIAISRVYVGVHYPADVIAGAALGATSAMLMIAFHNYISKYIPLFNVLPFVKVKRIDG